MITRKQLAPQRQRDITFVTPRVEDLILFEIMDAQRVGTIFPAYGTAHPDTTKWPNHKLVHIRQGEDSQSYHYYYAADRDSQDSYNYELREGKQLMRTYVLPRADYPANLPVPVGGAPDTTFTDYGFTGDSIINVEEPLNGIYIAIQRTYELITVVSTPYDSNLERNVTVTRTLKPAGFLLTDPDPDLVSTAGVVYDIEHGNNYHDVLVKTESGLDFTEEDSYPLDVIYSTVANYPLPPKLSSYVVYAVNAEAIQDEPPNYSFAQDFMALPVYIPPRRGPFKIRIERFITDEPGAVIDTILDAGTKLPATKDETVAVILARAWGVGEDSGVTAQAFAREFPVVDSYHTGVTASLSGAVYATLFSTLTNTPGFTGDLSGSYLIDVDMKPASTDLFEVAATYLVLTGDIYT